MSEQDERRRPQKLAHYIRSSDSLSGLSAAAAAIVLLTGTYFDLWITYIIGMGSLVLVVITRGYSLLQQAMAGEYRRSGSTQLGSLHCRHCVERECISTAHAPNF
jgi:hypothetical protein